MADERSLMTDDHREHGLDTGIAVRLSARTEAHTGPTAGLAAGYVQANLVMLPQMDAAAFLRFCTLNPIPCPLLAVSEPGERGCPTLAEDLDLAHDVPRYRVFRHGEPVEECGNVAALWRNDLVTFVLGCSFTFEHALLAYRIPMRHIHLRRNVAMYRSNLSLTPAGPFSGDMVVSMRPLRPADAIRAVQICTRFSRAHGAPIHFGDPAAIGIHDLAHPDYGDPVEVAGDEYPVFWACGVTPQRALESARLPFAITHSPGHMLVTDLRDTELALL